MLYISDARRYFLYTPHTDMRKGYDGLCGLIREGMRKDPLSGDIFIFLNRRRNQVKLLLWDRDGFALYAKRLERGTYEVPSVNSEQGSILLSRCQLTLILKGIHLQSVRTRKRFGLNNNE